MKILRVITVFEPSRIYGGPVTGLANHTRGLVARGHEITIATTNVVDFDPARRHPPGRDEAYGAIIERFPSRVVPLPVPRNGFPRIHAPRLNSWLRREASSYDVIHIHFGREWVPLTAASIAIASGVPTFLQTHGMLGRTDGYRSVIDSLWTTRLLSRAHGVFSLQPTEDSEIRSVAKDAHVLRLYNGINPVAPPSRHRHRPGRPVVLFVGRLHPRKRVDVFLRVAALLRERGVDAEYRVIGADEGERKRAENLATDLRLGGSVTFTGALDSEQVMQHFAEASLYVMSSLDEPFGQTVLEALAVGVPIVVNDTAHLAPLLKRNGSAIVTDPTPEAMAIGAYEVLTDVQLRDRLVSRGFRLLDDKLSLRAVVDRLEDVYLDALSHAGAGLRPHSE